MMRKFFAAILLISAFAVYADAQDDFVPDRPGMSTGPRVMKPGKVMWETGFEGRKKENGWSVLLPTTMFRAGISDFAELRLEYDGLLLFNDSNKSYVVEPLEFGAKFRLFDGKGGITKISFLANLLIPCTRTLCAEMSVAPELVLLFEHNVCHWFSIGYNAGGLWNGKRTATDVFLALNLAFAPCDRIGLFLESYNTLVYEADVDNFTLCDIDTGVTWKVLPNLQLDLYTGVNLSEQFGRRFIIGGGIAWGIN